MGGAYLMFCVAALCAIGGVVWFLKPARSDASVYRHRIGATMLIGAAMILTGYAIALVSWDRAASTPLPQGEGGARGEAVGG